MRHPVYAAWARWGDKIGHLFITRADLTTFECDDWLIPTDRWGKVELQWWKNIEPALRVVGASKPESGPSQEMFHPGGPRYMPVEVTGRPKAWIGWTASDEPRNEWFVSGATEFVDHVVAAGSKAIRHGRSRRLVAVPLVGAGKGGGAWEAGTILDAMIPALDEKAREHDVDIALVTWAEDEYAAAQAVRREIYKKRDLWPELDDKSKSWADLRAKSAAAGKLVVFFGAGLGAGSGIPLWKDLIDQLMSAACLDNDEREVLPTWSALDQAQYLERALADVHGGSIGNTVAELIRDKGFVNLSIASLANLPVEGLITTNYDKLFEQAAAAIKSPVVVLPYDPHTGASRWLLKMHGCIDYVDDIVLTRNSYTRYAERNQALAGIVQAMLITKEMLFLGFSLSDENFLRIMDAVRRAVSPRDPRPGKEMQLGTALMLKDEPVMARRWRRELDLFSPSTSSITDAEAARRLEIFLDYMLFRTASTKHLLRRRLRGTLNREERALVECLEKLVELAPASPDSTAWAIVNDMLQRLGHLESEQAPEGMPEQ